MKLTQYQIHWTRKEILLPYNSQNTKHTEKVKNIKSFKEKNPSHIYKQTHQYYTQFLNRVSKARRALANVLQTLDDPKCQPKLLYSAKLSITINGEPRYSMKKSNLKTIFIVTQPYRGY